MEFVDYRLTPKSNMKILEYKTVSSRADEKELDHKVNELIREGFQPFGNPFFLQRTPPGIQLCQAMVKYDDSQ